MIVMELRPFPKLKPEYDLEFREWIKRQVCCVCKSKGVKHDDGIYRVTPSHMLTRGAGRSDYYNLLPMCVLHHEAFEGCSSQERSTWHAIAERYTVQFLEIKTGRQS